MAMYTSSDHRLKDFYYNFDRDVIVSTKRSNKKDLTWRQLANRPGYYAQLMVGPYVIKTVRRGECCLTFNVPMTDSQLNDMLQQKTPKKRVVRFKSSLRFGPVIPSVEPKLIDYHVYKINVDGTWECSATKNFLEDARGYAEHLAKLNPGIKIAVIQIHGIVKASGVVWE